MNLSTSAFLIFVSCFSFSLISFYIASKVDAVYQKAIIPAGFYFLTLSFIGVLVFVSVVLSNPVACESLVNSTITVGNTTDYTYINSCVDNNTDGVESLFIILLWTFYGICAAMVILLFYLFWVSVRDLF